MNYNFTQVFVPTNKYITTGNGFDALGSRVLGVFTPTYVASTDDFVSWQSVNFSAGTPTASATQPFKELIVAMGTGTGFAASKYGSFKSPVIKKGKVLSATRTVADNTTKQQITYIGWDEVNDEKSPVFACDEEYVLTIKIDEYWSKGIYQPMIQESVRVKTACCTECGSNCDPLNCYDYMSTLAAKVNANPLLSKYITATHVFKGSAPTYKYTLVLPDAGTSIGGVSTVVLDTTAATGFTDGSYTAITQSSTSGSGTSATFNFTVAGGVLTAVSVNAAGSGYAIGEVITFLGTKITGGTTPADDFTITVTSTTGPEGTLLNALKAYYPAATYGAITFTTDTDGNPDTDSLGNSMFEILTPLITNVADMPLYNGVAWEKKLATAGSVTACGIKLEGKALDAFGNACVPDAVPYVFNLVRFQAVVHEGPYNTQDFDIPSDCSPWAVTKVQDVKYPIGAGVAMAELERHFFRNNLPNVAESVYYWNPIYNEDVNTFLFVNSSLLYNVVSIIFLDDSAVGYEKKSVNSHELLIMVDTANDTANTVTNNLVAYFSSFII